jgi:hypothetical protein
MFWWIVNAIGGALSVGTLNPAPLLVTVVLSVVCRSVEKPLREQVQAAGRNPDMPPPPTSAMGCVGCTLWFVVMGLVVLFLAGVCLAVLEGKIS